MAACINAVILVCFVNRAFEDVKVSWRVTFNQTSVVLQSNGTNLAKELIAVTGVTTCKAGQIQCMVSIEIQPDNVSTYNELVTSPNYSPTKYTRMWSNGEKLENIPFALLYFWYIGCEAAYFLYLGKNPLYWIFSFVIYMRLQQWESVH